MNVLSPARESLLLERWRYSRMWMRAVLDRLPGMSEVELVQPCGGGGAVLRASVDGWAG